MLIIPNERKKFFITPFYYSIFREKEESELILEKDGKLPITQKSVGLLSTLDVRASQSSFSKINCTMRNQHLRGGNPSREPFPQGFIFHHGKFTNENLSKVWLHHIMVRFHSGGERFHSHHRAVCVHGRAAGGQVTRRLGDVVHKSVVLLL